MSKSIKYLFFFLMTGVLSVSMIACNSDDDNSDDTADYKDWKEYNESWLIDQISKTNPDGTSYYQRCVSPTDPQAYVLMHSIGPIHSENLKPLYTSSTQVNYTLTLVNDSIVDQGTDFVSQLNSSTLITGWGLAIMQLHVGDSAQFVLPYNVAYGTTGATVIPPYSDLIFNIRLVDIPAYEVKP